MKNENKWKMIFHQWNFMEISLVKWNERWKKMLFRLKACRLLGWFPQTQPTGPDGAGDKYPVLYPPPPPLFCGPRWLRLFVNDLAIFSHDDLATFLSSTSKISTTNTRGVRCGAPSTMLFVDIRRAHSQLRTILRQKSCAQVAGGHSKFGSSQNQENEKMKFHQWNNEMKNESNERPFIAFIIFGRVDEIMEWKMKAMKGLSLLSLFLGGSMK